ncbi:MAG: Rhs element Vgr protein [Pseudomonadota bacterium]
MESLHFHRLRARRWRHLTTGEIAIASLLFRDAVDYGRVRIYRRRYMPFQPKNCAMSPNGAIYFHQSCCLLDFSTGSEQARHWFMHEMTHVWQHQLGYPVRLRGAIRLGLSYRYRLAQDKNLSDFNMEAQGDVLADYFALKFLHSATPMRQPHYADQLALFETVLANFRADPSDIGNLPKGILTRLR